jgi:hypothetical protein
MLCPIYLSAKMCSESGSLALEDSGYQNGELLCDQASECFT